MFKFKLEPLLRHRKHVEENYQKELGVLHKSLAAEKEKLSTYKKKKADYVTALNQCRQGNHTASDIIPYYRYIDRISEEVEAQRSRVMEAKRLLDLKRMELIEAVKKRKTLDRLKDKEASAYRQMEDKQEQKAINDVATQQYFRRQ